MSAFFGPSAMARVKPADAGSQRRRWALIQARQP